MDDQGVERSAILLMSLGADNKAGGDGNDKDLDSDEI